MPLVGLDLALQHRDPPPPLNQVVPPASAVQHLPFDQERAVAVAPSLLELALVDDAVLVLAAAAALLQPIDHLSPEANLPELALRHHFEHEGSGESALLEGGLVLAWGRAGRRAVLLKGVDSLLQFVLFELQLHDQFLQRGDPLQERGHCVA
jgi:hypothetical protein